MSIGDNDSKSESSIDAIRATEETVHALMNAVTDGVLLLEKGGTIVALNEAGAGLLGRSRADLAGKHLVDLLPSEAGERVKARFDELLRSGRAVRFGEELGGKPFDIHIHPVLDGSGSVTRFALYARGIAGTARAGEARDESGYRIGYLANKLPQGIVIAQTDPDRLVFANPAMYGIIGYTVEELTSLSPEGMQRLVHPEDRPVFFERFRERLEGKKPVQKYEFRAVKKDGTLIWLEIHSDRIEYLGEPTVIATFSDVTDKRRAEEALRRKEEEWRSLVENAPDFILIIDRSGKILFINRTPPGINVEGVIGRSIYEYVQPEHHDQMRESAEKVVRTGDIVSLETTVTAHDGTVSWYSNRLGPIKHGGEVIALMQISTDITEQKKSEEELRRHREQLEDLVEERTVELKSVNDLLLREIAERGRVEEELRESEARYRGIVEDQTELICRFLPDTTITFVNEAYCRCFGKRREELIGHSFLPLVSEEGRESTRQHIASLSEGNPVGSHDQRSLVSTGELKWQQWTNRAIFNGEGRLVEYQAVGRDIDKRKKAEEALERRNRELGALNEINSAVNSEGESMEILQNIMRTVVGFCNAEYAGLYEVDRENGRLSLIAAYGVPEDIQERIKQLKADVDKTKNMVESNGVVVAEEDIPIAEPEYYSEIKDALGIKRNIAFVSGSRGRKNFLALIGSRLDEDISPEIRNFIEIAGNQLGIAFERLELLRTLENREKDLKKLTAGLIDTIEDERRRMALSLHDEMGQSLVALNVEFDLLEKRVPPGDEKCRELLKSVREQLRHIAENTRRISYSLHPSMLEDLGLIPALQWYVDSFIVSDELKVDIGASGFDEEIPLRIGLTLYRVAQESLKNVSRHSNANHVSLKLTKGYPRVIMMIEDNGKGFSLEEEDTRKGLGIVGMRERIERLGGDFRIKSAPGKGTRIRVTLPLEVYDGGQG